MLDANLGVLAQSKIRGGGCTAKQDSLTDARLLLLGPSAREAGKSAEIWMTGTTYSMGGAACQGHWLTKLRVTFGSRARDATSSRLAKAVRLSSDGDQSSSQSDGSVFDVFAEETEPGEGTRLVSRKNAGLLVSSSGELVNELVDTAPDMRWVGVHGNSDKEVTTPAPVSFASEGESRVRNSIHPVWVEKLGAYLGIAHRHYFDKQDIGYGGEVSTNSFQFGSSYRHILYT